MARNKKTEDPDAVKVKELWELLRTAQESMLAGFPALWDAYWYGQFSFMLEETALALGEDKVAKIVGQTKYRQFKKKHDEILEGMHGAAHRIVFDEEMISRVQEGLSDLSEGREE